MGVCQNRNNSVFKIDKDYFRNHSSYQDNFDSLREYEVLNDFSGRTFNTIALFITYIDVCQDRRRLAKKEKTAVPMMNDFIKLNFISILRLRDKLDKSVLNDISTRHNGVGGFRYPPNYDGSLNETLDKDDYKANFIKSLLEIVRGETLLEDHNKKFNIVDENEKCSNILMLLLKLNIIFRDNYIKGKKPFSYGLHDSYFVFKSLKMINKKEDIKLTILKRLNPMEDYSEDVDFNKDQKLSLIEKDLVIDKSKNLNYKIKYNESNNKLSFLKEEEENDDNIKPTVIARLKGVNIVNKIYNRWIPTDFAKILSNYKVRELDVKTLSSLYLNHRECVSKAVATNEDGSLICIKNADGNYVVKSTGRMFGKGIIYENFPGKFRDSIHEELSRNLGITISNYDISSCHISSLLSYLMGFNVYRSPEELIFTYKDIWNYIQNTDNYKEDIINSIPLNKDFKKLISMVIHNERDSVENCIQNWIYNEMDNTGLSSRKYTVYTNKLKRFFSEKTEALRFLYRLRELRDEFLIEVERYSKNNGGCYDNQVYLIDMKSFNKLRKLNITKSKTSFFLQGMESAFIYNLISRLPNILSYEYDGLVIQGELTVGKIEYAALKSRFFTVNMRLDKQWVNGRHILTNSISALRVDETLLSGMVDKSDKERRLLI